MATGSRGWKDFIKQAGELLYWAMLAACTVGPGTVVTCSRSGAEYGLALCWALILATILAFILQEGTVRLTVTSGLSLGQCLKLKYRHTFKIYKVALICWVISGCVFIGNLFFSLNCWAGGVDAVLAFPGASDVTGWQGDLLRIGVCVGYGVITMVLLWYDKTHLLGVMLGFVMMGMVVLFVIVVAEIGIDWPNFGKGLLPNIPSRIEGRVEPTDLVLSLVGTTALGFNLFLGGDMAKGRTLVSAQRGILFSVVSAMIVSLLILIVGAGQFSPTSSATYSIQGLSKFIRNYTGEGGVVVFALGFMAAALSSMITVILGANITARSMFFDEETDPTLYKFREEPLENRGDGQRSGGDDEKALPVIQTNPTWVEERQEKLRKRKHIMNQSINLIQTAISVIAIAANADRLYVILVAQVFNGALLPFFSMCLLLCINDPQFMKSRPQKGYANVFLFVSVTISLFLSSNTVLEKIVGDALAIDERLYVAIAISITGMAALSFFTSLGKNIVQSFKGNKITNSNASSR